MSEQSSFLFRRWGEKNSSGNLFACGMTILSRNDFKGYQEHTNTNCRNIFCKSQEKNSILIPLLPLNSFQQLNFFKFLSVNVFSFIFSSRIHFRCMFIFTNNSELELPTCLFFEKGWNSFNWNNLPFRQSYHLSKVVKAYTPPKTVWEPPGYRHSHEWFAIWGDLSKSAQSLVCYQPLDQIIK